MIPPLEGRVAATTRQQIDTRPAQAARIADLLEQHPASTQKEIDAACDIGCISKVLSDMPRMDYGLGKGLRRARATCAHMH